MMVKYFLLGLTLLLPLQAINNLPVSNKVSKKLRENKYKFNKDLIISLPEVQGLFDADTTSVSSSTLNIDKGMKFKVVDYRFKDEKLKNLILEEDLVELINYTTNSSTKVPTNPSDLTNLKYNNENYLLIEFLDDIEEDQNYRDDDKPKTNKLYKIPYNYFLHSTSIERIFFRPNHFYLEGSFQKLLTDAESDESGENNNNAFGFYQLVEFNSWMYDWGVHISVASITPNPSTSDYLSIITNPKSSNNFGEIYYSFSPAIGKIQLYDIDYDKKKGNYLERKISPFIKFNFGWNNRWENDLTVNDSSFTAVANVNTFRFDLGINGEFNVLYKSTEIGLFAGIHYSRTTLFSDIILNKDLLNDITKGNRIFNAWGTFFGVKTGDVFTKINYSYFNTLGIKGLSHGVVYLDFEAKMVLPYY